MIVHLNGDLVAADEAKVSVFDRGFVFGDGVYEGLRAAGGRIFALEAHVERLRAGLAATGLEGFDPAALGALSRTLLGANGLTDAFLYWQITRGAPPEGAPRRGRTPWPGGSPTVFGFAEELAPASADDPIPTRSAAIEPDRRWSRGRIKGISLLGNILSCIDAAAAGADDVIFVRDGLVVEGAATNVLLAKDGAIVTPALDSAPMLAGVTRQVLLERLPEIEQRHVREQELAQADEILLVGTRTAVAAVTRLDGAPVGDGAAGPAAIRLHRTLCEAIDREVGAAGVQ